MKILPVIQYSTYKKHSSQQPNFSSKYNAEKIGKVFWTSTITAGGITATYSINNTYRDTAYEKYKMTPEELDKYLQQQSGNPKTPPKIYNESKEGAQRIRETLIANNKSEYIPELYLDKSYSRFFKDLNNHDLSALQDILQGIENKNVTKDQKFEYYDRILENIYTLAKMQANEIKDDKFTEELAQIIKDIRLKRDAAFEETSDEIQENRADRMLIYLTKEFANKQAPSQFIESLVRNTVTITPSRVFIADKNAKNFKLPDKIFKQFIYEQFSNLTNVSPLVNAPEDETGIIRQIFIDNKHPEYIFKLYLPRHVGNSKLDSLLSRFLPEYSGNSWLDKKIEKQNIDEVSELVKCLGDKNLKEEQRIKFSATALEQIYDFIFENFEEYKNNDTFRPLDDIVKELQNYLAKFPNSGSTISANNYLKFLQKKYNYIDLTPDFDSGIARSFVGNEYKIPPKGNYTDIDNVIKCLKDPDVLNTDGFVLNFNDDIINSIADIVPLENNKTKYQEMINLLKNLKQIDYNKKDSYGISVMEKIMNAENPKLLEVVKDKKIKYVPELDYAYNNIADESFKNLIDNYHFNIEELTGALTHNDINKLNQIEDSYLHSPLILNNKNALSDIRYALRYSRRAFQRYFSESYPEIYQKISPL